MYRLSNLKSFLADKRPTKKLSQNFLIDLNVIEKLIKGADLNEEDTVLEIGPGLGAITQNIPNKTIAVEKDRDLARLLKQRELQNVQVVCQDILDYELPLKDLVVIGNLPFNITTPILEHLFFSTNRPKRCAFLVQKELAERLTAKPKTKAYGALTIFGHTFADIEYLFTVKSSCFYPKPDVDAAAIKITLKQDTPIQDPAAFSTFVKSLFSKRRKMLSTTLSSLYGKEQAAHLLESAQIDGSKRPEELTPQEIAHLFSKWEEFQDKVDLKDA